MSEAENKEWPDQLEPPKSVEQMAREIFGSLSDSMTGLANRVHAKPQVRFFTADELDELEKKVNAFVVSTSHPVYAITTVEKLPSGPYFIQVHYHLESEPSPVYDVGVAVDKDGNVSLEANIGE